MSDHSATEATTVYVVDDDAGMLESTQWLLESVGLNVEAYSDGRKFLDAVGNKKAGCVVLDVRMPGLGGLNVQEELQKRGLDLPIIFVSGHADVPIVVRAFKSGAFDFIESPSTNSCCWTAFNRPFRNTSNPAHNSRAMRQLKPC